MNPDLVWSTTFRYSIKSDTPEELRRRALEFDARRKAGALLVSAPGTAIFAGELWIDGYREGSLVPGAALKIDSLPIGIRKAELCYRNGKTESLTVAVSTQGQA
jgi:hypothetical protein